MASDQDPARAAGPVGGGHRVQASVRLFPAAGQEVVDTLLESCDMFVGQFGPLALWRKQFTDGVRSFEPVGKHASEASQPCLVSPERISDPVSGGLIHQDGDMELSGQALEAAGEIDDGAENRDFDLVRRADLPGDSTPVRDTNSQ